VSVRPDPSSPLSLVENVLYKLGCKVVRTDDGIVYYAADQGCRIRLGMSLKDHGWVQHSGRHARDNFQYSHLDGYSLYVECSVGRGRDYISQVILAIDRKVQNV